MKGSSRFLPRLNLCYLQKKAYQTHIQKLKNVKGSIKAIKRSHSQPIQSQRIPLKTLLDQKLTIIKEHSDRVVKLSPYHKKIQQQTQRQNLRLFQAIQKCPPTLDRKNLSKHSLQAQEFKQRICKFKVIPQLNKTLLKCQISLDKLSKSKVGMDRQYRFNSASKVKKYTKPQNIISHNEQSMNQLQQSQGSTHYKKQNTQSLLFSRNRNKIQNHFERSSFSMRTKQKLQQFRQNMQNKQNKITNSICKWKARCFTTQAESHQFLN